MSRLGKPITQHSFDAGNAYSIGEYSIISGFCTICDHVHSQVTRNGHVQRFDEVPSDIMLEIREVEDAVFVARSLRIFVNQERSRQLRQLFPLGAAGCGGLAALAGRCKTKRKHS